MDVAHVLHTVDGFLQRDNDRLLHRFGIGTGIRSRYLHRGRRNVWILLHRQPRQDMMPNKTIITEITMEKTGRSIKNRKFITSSSSYYGFKVTASPLLSKPTPVVTITSPTSNPEVTV